MIRLIAIILCSFMMAGVSCRIEKRIARKSKQAFRHYQEKEYADAAETFLWIAERYPESNLFGRNLWNAAWSYLEADSIDMAEQLFLRILRTNLQDSVRDSTRGIHETHTNYKHHSSVQLAKVAITREKHRVALRWVDSAQYRYPYYHDRIKQMRRTELLLDQLRSVCYESLGNYDSALVLMLKHCFTRSPWHNQLPTNRAMALIDRYFNRDSVHHALERGVESMHYQPTHAEIRFKQYIIPVVPFEGGMETINTHLLEDSPLYQRLCGVE